MQCLPRLRFTLLVLLTLPLLACGSQTIEPQGPVLLKDGQGELSLESHLSLYVDESNERTFDEVRAHPEWFHKNTEHRPQLAIGGELRGVWIRFQFQDLTKGETRWSLRERGIPSEVSSLYSLLEDGSVFQDRSGFRTPREKSHYKERLSLLDLPRAKKAPRTVYVKLVGRAFGPTLSLSTPDAHRAQTKEENLWLGLYLGLTLAMVLYNGFLFFALRDISYALYVLFISSFCFYISDQQAVLQHFLPFLSREGAFFSGAPLAVAEFATVLFIRSFLNTKANQPRMDRFLLLLAVGQCFTMATGFAGFHTISSPLGPFFGLGIAVAVPTATIISVRQGNTPAWYFLVSVSVLATASIIISLAWQGILPFSFMTDWGIMMGSAFDMVVLSLGLAARIRSMRKTLRNNEERTSHLERQTLSHRIETERASQALKEHMLARLFQSAEHDLDRVKYFLRNKVVIPVSQTLQDLEALGPLTSSTGISAQRALRQILIDSKALQEDSPSSHEATLSESLAHLCVALSQEETKIHWSCSPDWGKHFDEKEVPLHVYRIAQEALSNACKHGQATDIFLEGRREDDCSLLTIRDDGCGFVPETVPTGRGLGLATMRERARIIGADFHVESSLGKGTVLTLSVPG